jgi:hypothetical protein
MSQRAEVVPERSPSARAAVGLVVAHVPADREIPSASGRAVVADPPAPADAAVTARLRDAVELVLSAPSEPAAVETLEKVVAVHAREMERIGLPRQTTIDVVREAVADLIEQCRARPSAAVIALVLWRCVRWALAPTA